MKLVSGRQIDRYVVEELLGVGGMAEVWAVRHRVLGTRHALKLLIQAQTALQRRLLTEGRAQAVLDHPNLLPVRDVLEVDGQPALLLPLIDGPALDALLKVYRPTTPEALSLLRAVAEGLGFAHERGFIHRDLKPGNVLLDLRRGHIVPRISDFGLVKVERSTDAEEHLAGTIFGTPAYAAPEQLDDAAAVDRRADLFSLGVMLVRMLTGHRPFPGASATEIRFSHQHPPVLDGLEEPLRTLAADLLSTSPDQRPPNCAAVIARMDAIFPPRAPNTFPPLVDAVWRHRRERSTLQTLAPESPLGGETWATLEVMGAITNLPPARDAFIGRRRELAALTHRLRPRSPTGRLLTLTGPGGAGKTRLAVECGLQVQDAWPGGVWFCDLTEARTVGDIIAAVARVLEVPLGRAPAAQLAEAIRGRGPALFVLDNFEQIIEHAPQTLGRWMDTAKDTTFLVTSRQPLHLRGEQIVVLAPFDTEDAIALFVERARQADVRFSAEPDAQAVLTELVRLLDGLPLAIELAAARARSLPPRRLVERLGKRFRLLRSRSPELPPRQRTLRATLQWSWDLLRPWERDALAQASVFEGGFTFEAAEAVIDLSAHPEAPWVEDVLAELVDKNLLQTRDERLGMLVSVQAFARENLDNLLRTEERHGAFYARFGSRVVTEALNRHGGDETFQAQLDELDNLVAAARAAARRDDANVAADCARAVTNVFSIRGPFDVGLHLIQDLLPALSLTSTQERDFAGMEARLLQRTGDLPQAQARFARALEIARRQEDTLEQAHFSVDIAVVLRLQGRYDEALALLESSLHILDRVGFHRGQSAPLGVMANIYIKQNRYEDAERCLQRALRIARSSGDRRQEAASLGNLGGLMLEWGRFDHARDAFTKALTINQELNERHGEGVVLGNLGILEANLRRPDRARDYLQRALVIQRALRSRRSVGILLGNLGALLFDGHDYPAAEDRFEAALRIQRQIGNRSSQGVLLSNLGLVAYQQGKLHQALERMREALPILETTRTRRFEANTYAHIAAVHLERGALAPATAALHRAAARATDVHSPTINALIQLLHADLSAQRGDAQQAHQQVREAEPTLQTADDPALWIRYHLIVARVLCLNGDPQAAQRALREAQALIEAQGFPPQSTAQRALRTTRAIVG